MANSAQARKRARQAVKQRAHNASLRSTLRTAVKRVQKAIVAGDKAAAQSIYTESVSVIDRIADKKIVHKNKASRHKSRLSAQIKALAAWFVKFLFKCETASEDAVFICAIRLNVFDLSAFVRIAKNSRKCFSTEKIDTWLEFR